jgi:hypothetical protein
MPTHANQSQIKVDGLLEAMKFLSGSATSVVTFGFIVPPELFSTFKVRARIRLISSCSCLCAAAYLNHQAALFLHFPYNFL